MNKIEMNNDFKEALNVLLKTNNNIFITGKAGTGKSTFLKLAREELKKKKIKHVVLSTTGLAALNVGGQTIHSFFRFGRNISYSKVHRIEATHISKYQHLETIIIDEVSMLRADLLDCIDKFLRINAPNEKKRKMPFGGVQMVFIGDLYQLPPVVKETEAEQFAGELPQNEDEIRNLIYSKGRPKKYDSCHFLSASSIRRNHLHIINFNKIYRQNDETFIGILNNMRENTISQAEIDILNEQIIKDNISSILTLTTTNRIANDYNLHELEKLDKDTEENFYATIEGDKSKISYNDYPAEQTLTLREGARIMMLVNDTNGEYVNGTTGTIVKINIDDDYFLDSSITVKLDNGHIVDVRRHKWVMYETLWDEETHDYIKVEVASFKQYPIRLAWAITIHKSQGKTFDKIAVDFGILGAFACGQAYVAMSRCTSIEGIYLVIPIQLKDIFVDKKIGKLIKIQEQINQIIEQDKNSFFHKVA
jgi:ATP-dependent exoDNAse (exonuclease V) alpha subunit